MKIGIIKNIIRQIEELYFDINQYNEFYIEENKNQLRFYLKKENTIEYDFELNLNEELRIINIKNKIRNKKNEAKKYVIYFYIKKELENRGLVGFLTTNDASKKYFKNLKVKLTPIGKYTEVIKQTIEREMKEDERLFIDKKREIFEIINEKGEEKRIKIKYEDLERKNVILIQNERDVIFNGTTWEKVEMEEKLKKEIEKNVQAVINNDELIINERRIPILEIKKEEKNKIIIGKEVLEKEEIQKILVRI